MAVATRSNTTGQTGTEIRQLKGFDEMVRKLMRDWKVTGVSVAIVKDDDVILSKGYGLRNLKEDLPADPHTLMPIGSTTKTFTTAAIGLLADEGVVDWDTPVRQYIPSFALWDGVAGERLTPRDMASHRSGLPRHDLMWYGSTDSRADIFSRLRYLQPTSDFRTTWQYQNLMFMSLGYLTEVVSGMPWEDFIQKRMLDPLGMVSTRTSSTAARESPDLAIGYMKKKNSIVAMDLYEGFNAVAPAGSIVSSVFDMSQWLRVHVNGGKHGDRQFLTETQIRQMHAPQMVMPPGKHPEMPHSSYGLGWFVQPYRGHNMIHHGGNIDGFSSMFAILPEERVGVVILTNMNGTPLRDILQYNVFDRFIDGKQVAWNARVKADWKTMEEAGKSGKQKAKTDRVRGTRPSHRIEQYAGIYRHPGYGSVGIDTADGKLSATYNGMEFTLKHYHYDTFEMSFEKFGITQKISFLTDVRGEINAISAPLEPTVDDIVFTRVPDASMTDRDFLERFVGTYEVMGAVVSIEFKGDVLSLSIPGQPEYELVPIKGTEFGVKGVTGISVEFVADEAGAVIEARLTQMGATFTAKRR